MKKILLIIAGLCACVSLWTGPASAANEGQVCVDNGTKVEPADGVKSVTVTAPDGHLISGYCVKAGSVNQGLGPEYVTVDPPAASVTITHSSGKDISHYTVTYVEGETPPTTTTVPSVEPPTTTMYVLPCYNNAQIKVPGCNYDVPVKPPVVDSEPVVEVDTPVVEDPAPAVEAEAVTELAYTGSPIGALLSVALGLIIFGGTILSLNNDPRKPHPRGRRLRD